MTVTTPTPYEVAAFLDDIAPFFGGRRLADTSAALAFEFRDGCTVTAELPSEHGQHLVLVERWSRGGMELAQWDGEYITAFARLAPVEKPQGRAVLTYEGKTRRLNYTVRSENIDSFFADAHERRVRELADELGLPLEYAAAMVSAA